MNICMGCFEEYANGSIPSSKDGKVICPKVNCIGEVVEIDELIHPAIVMLNNNGYITRNCCSGHFKDKYIHFYVVIYGHVTIQDIPKGFTVEHTSLLTSYDVSEDVTIIRFEGDDNIRKDEYKTMNLTERMIAILEINVKFLNWVDSMIYGEYKTDSCYDYSDEYEEEEN